MNASSFSRHRAVNIALTSSLAALTACSAPPGEAPQTSEPATESTGEVAQTLAAPLTVQSTLADVPARRLNIASYWNKSYEEQGGFGSWSTDGSQRSIRRAAAGFLSLERAGAPKVAPANLPALFETWTNGIGRYTFEGSPGLLDGDGAGDYDMNEREIISLLYSFKDKPALLTNNAAFNLVAKGIYFWYGNATSHAMLFTVGPLHYSETENHSLMILSSQYLTNQWIRNNYRKDTRWSSLSTIQALVPRTGAGGTPAVAIPSLDYFKNNADLENKLLQLIGRIPHAGYFETNGRNYQAISLHALWNLYAFADSDKIRAAAKNALDYSAAKFAFQSLDGKRFPPHRRHYEYTERAGIWENDSTMFMWSALSGAGAFGDSYNAAGTSTDIDTNFFNYNDQARGFALWALVMNDDRLLGSRRYEIPVGIHDFMLDKHNGYWARFQDRFTQNHYRQGYESRYFYDDGTPYLSGTFVPAPELMFVTNRFMNVAGGNHVEYDLKGGTLNGHIYDFWARPSAVIPANHYQFRDTSVSPPVYRYTGDWGGKEVHRTRLNQDILNMSSQGDEWWYGKNLGVYKNFTIGTDPANVPRDPHYPLFEQNGKTEFVNEFETLKYRFQHVHVPGSLASYFIALGEVVGHYYFWEIVPYERFDSIVAFKDMLLSRNYGAGQIAPDGSVTLVLSNGEIVVTQPTADYPIQRVISHGNDVPLNRFWYDWQFPAANPLMEVFEVDSNYDFTGVRYAENPASGLIHIWNPFVKKFLAIDSSDYKNPKRSESTSPVVTARPDMVTEITPSAGYWGTWYGPKFCPKDQYAVSYKMRVEGGQGSNDDTSLNAVQLECRPVDGSSSTFISAHDGYWGSWTGVASCANSKPNALTNFLNGAQLRVEAPQGSGDDTAANDATFACSGGGTVNPGGGRPYGTWSNMTKCPQGSVVCGLSSRVEGPQGSDDDTAMNGLRLICCTQPPPACPSPINEPWATDLGATASAWTPRLAILGSTSRTTAYACRQTTWSIEKPR